jgi:hypothetical protein
MFRFDAYLSFAIFYVDLSLRKNGCPFFCCPLMKSAGPIWKTSIPDELYEKNKPIPFKVFFSSNQVFADTNIMC